jgi:hypothetical protein
MHDDGSRRRRGRLRAGIALCLVVAVAASLGLTALATGLGGSHDAAQNLDITLAKGSTTVSSAAPLASGLTKISAKNTGPAPSNVLVARIRPGKTFDELTAAVNRSAAIPEEFIATITSFFGLAPGQTFTTTLSLPPGDYIATQPPQGKGTGPVTQFSVSSAAAGGSPPATVGKIQLFDYGIRGATSIKGKGTLAIENIGQNFHFLESIRLNDPSQASEVIQGIKSGHLAGPPPGQPVSIVGIVQPDTTNYVNINLKKGTYVIACFNSDRHSAGHNHSQYGMVRKLVVK